MFRELFNDFEEGLERFAGDVRQFIAEKTQSPWSQEKFSGDLDQRKEEFIRWGKEYVENLKENLDAEKWTRAKENFLSLVRMLGINDQLLAEAFKANKKELLDPLIGEMVAIVTLVLGWNQKDKEAFSQALGEIGVFGVFAMKPFVCLIAICGLAFGYQKYYHKEAFKKGGLMGFAGLSAAWLAPGAFVGILAAIVAMVYVNRKISVDKPVETQVKEIFRQIKSGEIFKESRQTWKNFEAFLAKLITIPNQSETN